jgi:hypothetical protein
LKQLIKILLTTIIALLIICLGTIAYLKHSAQQIITKKKLNDIIAKINSAPALPKDFKDIYSNVYPNIFNNNFNSNLISAILGNTQEQCPSRQVANNFWSLSANTKPDLMQKLNYAGFIWLLEDNVSQEKCFEYKVSCMDFLYNTKGINQAASYYYKKPLDSLTVDEQLGLILKIQNPSFYNNFSNQDKCDEGVKKLKKKITEREITYH